MTPLLKATVRVILLLMSNISLTSSTDSGETGVTRAVVPVADGDVAAVREFNRFYTGVLGLLREGLLDTPYSLTEARIIFELARQDEAEVAEMRRWLDLDAGYLSRILARFEADGLVRRSRSPGDGRRQVIALTQTGRAVFGRLDALSNDQIRGLLAPITAGRRSRLTAAMAGIREILAGAPAARTVVLRPPVPGDLGWVVQRNAALYAAEYGWDETYEALVARIIADYAARADRNGEAAWIAEVAGDGPAACSACARTGRPRNCACCWWSRPRAAWASAGAWSPSAWPSPAGHGYQRDRAVDQRRAARRPPDLPAGRVRAGRLAAASQLRPRPGGPGLAAARSAERRCHSDGVPGTTMPVS